MIRRTLPQRRAAETFGMRFWNQPFTVTVGFYPDGTPGEVFIEGCKTGNDIQSIARDAGVLLSLALQHGTPIEIVRHAITRGSRPSPGRSCPPSWRALPNGFCRHSCPKPPEEKHSAPQRDDLAALREVRAKRRTIA